MRPGRTHALTAFIALFALLYAAFGVASPFWPRFFESRGLSAEQIGLLMARLCGAAVPAALRFTAERGPRPSRRGTRPQRDGRAARRRRPSRLGASRLYPST
jgi:hypothetical protein